MTLEVRIVRDLKLKIDDKAMEKILHMGGEVHIYTGVVGAG